VQNPHFAVAKQWFLTYGSMRTKILCGNLGPRAYIYIYPYNEIWCICILSTQLLFSTIFVGDNHLRPGKLGRGQAGDDTSSESREVRSPSRRIGGCIRYQWWNQFWGGTTLKNISKTNLKGVESIETKGMNHISELVFHLVSFRIAETIDIFNSNDQDSMRDD
jgi:hypothetical protein